MALYNAGNVAKPFSDTSVDDLENANSGVIDSLPTLDIDIADSVITKNLEDRIQDSIKYWNNTEGFNLEKNRNENMRMYLGKHVDTTRLYKYQTPYVENQIYIGINAIIAYLTARTATPETYPTDDSPQAKNFSQSLEKALQAWASKQEFAEKQEDVVRNTLIKRLGALHFYFDPDEGDDGEVCVEVVDPEHLVIDKNARAGKNPAFIAHMLKMTANEALSRWPEKKDELFGYLGIKKGTPKQLDQILSVRKVCLTHYNKQFKAQEAVVYYVGNVVLEKSKDPNWIYTDETKNFLPCPQKPYIPLNFDNDGNHWIDYTSPIEQARNPQEVLNKRGRQLMEAADKANGLVIFSADSGLTKDDVQNITFDPNQRLVIKTNGKSVADLVHQIPPQQISDVLVNDKTDLRTQVHAILGTPSEFTGTPDGSDNEETLGQSTMKKNQASGRQDLYVRAIDRFNARVFRFAVQMFAVWYDKQRKFVHNSGDGEFDYVTMSRDLIQKGTVVNVQNGSTTPFDKSGEEAIGLALMKMGAIAPLDGYKMLHLQNPQRIYDNFAKFKTDPMELARNAMDELESNKAYTAYADIMNGRKIEDPEDVDKEFVLTMRKLMLQDSFLKAPRKRQTVLLDYVEKAIKSLDLRTSLDQMAEEQGVDSLNPNNPIQPPQPPQPPMGAPGMPPQGPQGSALPPAPGQSQPMMPPQGMPMLPQAPQAPTPPAGPNGLIPIEPPAPTMPGAPTVPPLG